MYPVLFPDLRVAKKDEVDVQAGIDVEDDQLLVQPVVVLLFQVPFWSVEIWGFAHAFRVLPSLTPTSLLSILLQFESMIISSTVSRKLAKKIMKMTKPVEFRRLPFDSSCRLKSEGRKKIKKKM